MKVPQPLHKKVVVSIDPIEQISRGGIFIPEVVKRTHFTGEVKAVSSKVSAIHTKERVLFPADTGAELTVEGEKFLLINAEHLIILPDC